MAKKCNFECEKPETKLYDKACVRDEADFWYADIKDFNVDIFDDYAEECLNEPQCKSITYRKDVKHCWLKNKRGGENGPTRAYGYASMNMECDASELNTSCKDIDTDYQGSDIRKSVADTFKDCAVFCRDTENYVPITYRSSDSSCWLKDKKGHNWITATPHSGLISMNKRC